MPERRISVNIGPQVDKIKKLLQAASEDRTALLRLANDPLKEFSKTGINLSEFASKKFSKDAIASDIRRVIMVALDKNIKDRLKGFIAETDYHMKTSSGFEYNFDHSSSTDYKYELHTGTERGTSSETTTSEAINTDVGFSALLSKEFGEFLRGPLISDKVIQTIVVEIERTLAHAKLTIGR